MPAEFYNNIKPALSELTKPQSEHFARFVTGLIVSPNKTVEGITQASVYAKDQSALNRFLTVSPWKRKRVRNAVLRTAQHRRLLGSGCAFVLDDTLNEKRGKHMDAAGWFFDHCTGHTIWGHQLVTSGYVTPHCFVPFDVDLYIKQKDCSEEDFLTKNQRARYLLNEAHAVQSFSVVLIDSWYANEVVLGHCQRKNWQYITEVRCNRRFTYRDVSWRADEYAATLTLNSCERHVIKGHLYELHGIDVHVDGLGDQQLVCSRRWSEKKAKWSEWRYLLTSFRFAEPETILRWYLKRWSIETFHEVGKQELGLGEYQLRKHRGIVRHLFLVLVAYLLVLLWSSAALLEATALTMEERIRQFRAACERIIITTSIKLVQHMGEAPVLQAIGL